MAETGRLRDDPLWFKDAVFYEIYVRGFYDSNGDGVGDFRGLTEKLDYLEWLGVDCLWLLPMYASPLARRRLRHRRLLLHPARVRHARRLPRIHRRRPRARHTRHHRPRRQPHLRPAPVVQGGIEFARLAQARLVCLERRSREVQGGAHHLHRHREVELDLVRDGARVLLAPLLLAPARPQLRQPGSSTGHARSRVTTGSTSASTASAPTPCPISTSARAPTARICPRRTTSSKRCARTSRQRHPHALLLAEANQWPEDVVEYFGAGRRVPHGLPLPHHAAPLHGAASGRPPPHRRDSGAHARHPRELPVGNVPPQPRRADAGDGDGRGARLPL